MSFLFDYFALARLLVRRDNSCQPLITNRSCGIDDGTATTMPGTENLIGQVLKK